MVRSMRKEMNKRYEEIKEFCIKNEDLAEE
jgi:hypothetical protein